MGLQATVPRIIMTNAVLVAARDTLIIPGRKHPVADTRAQAELFITNAPDALQQQQAHTEQQHHTTQKQDAQQNTRQPGHRIAVREEHTNGMDTITFYVLFVETSVIQVQNGALCIAVQV